MRLAFLLGASFSLGPFLFGGPLLLAARLSFWEKVLVEVSLNVRRCVPLIDCLPLSSLDVMDGSVFSMENEEPFLPSLVC